MTISRRQFLASAATLAAAPMARAAAPAPLTVFIYLKGGNDGFNTFVPFTNEKYRKLRPTLALAREDIIPVTATHGFHRALAALMPAWEAKDLALIQGIGQQEITNQHYRDLEMQFTATSPGDYRAEGWLTRAMLTNPLTRGAALDAIAFGDLDIREADPMGPFRGDKLSVVHMQHPSEWLARHQVEGTQHLATHPAAQKKFSAQVPALSTRFPQDEFADALRATAELAAAGLAPPVVHITANASSGDQHHAFDTHWDQQKYHAAALARLAGGLAAFREAMIAAGQWQRTLVVTYDEFGRSPRENDAKGTHHGWSSVHVAMGGRVKGGLFGASVPVVEVFSIDGPAPVIDYRSLYSTIIRNWWGGDATGVFDRRYAPLDLLRA